MASRNPAEFLNSTALLSKVMNKYHVISYLSTFLDHFQTVLSVYSIHTLILLGFIIYMFKVIKFK